MLEATRWVLDVCPDRLADASHKSLTQLLNARQLGLKLMAVSPVMCGMRNCAIVRLIPSQNVTYGYTSATYSGRMPCIEVADSIVQTGRETLEKVGSTYSSL